MAENKKIYITANELAEMLGVSVGDCGQSSQTLF